MNLQRVVISGTSPGPRLLILGGVHGDEYEPIAAVFHLASLIERENLRGEVTLVPIVNEPAFQQHSRTGPDGLDLARTFPGSATGSPTEQIAHAANELIQQSDFLIDLHTGGLAMRITPLVGYMLVADEGTLAAQRRMAQAFGMPVVWGSSATLEGRSLSAARDANVPAIYAEWGGGGGCDPRGVADYVQGCLRVMGELDMLPGTVPVSPVSVNSAPLVVEDRRTESGLLQIQYPAPHPGFYELTAPLGQEVSPGDELGRLFRLDGEAPTIIRAVHTGLLILARALPAVAEGDCLAFVLEAQE
ncbi:MAG: M14 family metallopeptidase [Pirellulaceae bacterium]